MLNLPLRLCLIVTLLGPFLAASAVANDRTPASSTAPLQTPDDLQVSLFAAEPMLLNPSNIDVDHLGRVWVCEIVNYRPFRNRENPTREEGDRILVLEDTDGDGKADRKSTFYQGTDIDSPHGVCVLGNRVIVSANGQVLSLYDDDGDLKADRKEVMFTGIGGEQHDHGIHSVCFGPDGRLYFNFGNSGSQIRRPDGSLVIDKAGNEVRANRKPYQEGMAFRCELDGSNFETIGWNFRNNWELAVDSFGNVWQSDNDDDGNRGVRINFVMEFGNYGYRDELTGAGWRQPRTGWHAEVPLRHWHQNDPGVIPNLLHTGAGSPCGMCIYEGYLLPERFRGEMIHADAGPNIVRAYPVEAAGAGFSAAIEDVVDGERDQWFRPTDVSVAPDGSLIISDWYDPGVGGHRMGDTERGRIFRISTPDNQEYTAPLESFVGAGPAAVVVVALASPNTATRYIAWESLRSMGIDAEDALKFGWQNSNDSRYRARVLWLLAMLDNGEDHLHSAFPDDDPDLRVTAIRAWRRVGLDPVVAVKELIDDPSPQVRRELLIALSESQDEQVPQLWAKLAEQHAAGDRWYLEALGIAARGRWDECLGAWLDRVGDDWDDKPGREIVWRSRAIKTSELLKELLLVSHADASLRKQYFRAFDFQPKQSGSASLNALVSVGGLDLGTPAGRDTVRLALLRLDPKAINKSSQMQSIAFSLYSKIENPRELIEFARHVDLASQVAIGRLVEIAISQPQSEQAVDAVSLLFDWNVSDTIAATLSGDRKRAVRMAEALTTAAEADATELLRKVILDPEADSSVRRECVRAFCKRKSSAAELLELARSGKLDTTLRSAAIAALWSTSFADVRQAAAKEFPPPETKGAKPLPSLIELAKRRGDPKHGRVIYGTVGTCIKCHKVNGEGKEVGPDLSEIGSKLSRQAMFESIVYPSAGISHNYEAWSVVTVDGQIQTGLLVSDTDEAVVIRSADGIARTIPQDEIDETFRQDTSLMPADLPKVLSEQELVDVVEFLTTLRKK
ncbi:PVC-type heme-binding CxxCH protein [Stratiformator vulcanicus]|uniref:Cytochrome c domain-containing protein n=1 Tax=Stratiformator vulcanicus TaxID=2527980 RepID=A0A517R5C5_9PLAN|nr:PVC-type heme-binding CxxCH protein [Stratiformator vulcanicus]QDT39072.1 hypothetical protein Pan189_34740 [Stratiformator vulcanicus]